MELLKWLFRQVFSLKRWNGFVLTCLGREEFTWFLIIFDHANKYWILFVEAKAGILHFSHLLLTYQGTKITRVVVQCSEAWTKRITTAVTIFLKGENGSLLYLICTKNIPKIVKFRSTFESPFSLGFLACPEKSWDCYSCAYIGAISLQTKPLHIAQTTPWNRSSRLLSLR